MSNQKKEPCAEINDYYRVVSGTSIPVHGKSDYAVFTNKGQGFGFYEDGDYVLVCDKTSYESVGNEMPSNNDGSNPLNLAKWIHAKNGDIKIEAPNGTIHLEAKNIHISAVGGDPDGNIIIKAKNQVEVSSKDGIKFKCLTAIIDASLALDINTQFFNNVSQFATSGTSIDAAAGTLTAASDSLKTFSDLQLSTNTPTENLEVGESNAETIAAAQQEQDLIESQEARTLLDGGSVTNPDGSTSTFELL